MGVGGQWIVGKKEITFFFNDVHGSLKHPASNKKKQEKRKKTEQSRAEQLTNPQIIANNARAPAIGCKIIAFVKLCNTVVVYEKLIPIGASVRSNPKLCEEHPLLVQ